MPETNTKDIDFVCHACKAVGEEVEVNVPSIVGGGILLVDDDHDASTTIAATATMNFKNRKWIMQESRPTVCVLCSHDKGIHAMHPLLDVHGPEGRQLTWNGRGDKHNHPSTTNDVTPRRRPSQLAWVHTLCASMICSNANTRGCVYGCDKNGNYYYGDDDEGDDEEEEAEFDDSFESKDGGATPTTGDIDINDGSCSRRVSINSLTEEEEETSDVSTRYFAIAAEGVYARTISNHRKLKCFICGRKDDTWRIPLQCAAGDYTEYSPFQERHPRGTDRCTVAVHVGCARWGCVEPEGSHLEIIDGKRCNLCFFTPGRDDDDDNDDDRGGSKKENKAENDSDGTTTMEEASDTTETVAHCYCTAHAREIAVNKPGNTRKRKVDTDKSSIASHSEHVERMQVFPRDRKDRGLTRREMSFANGNISNSRRQLINRVNKF